MSIANSAAMNTGVHVPFFILCWSTVDLQCCVSGVQKSESVIRVSTVFHILFPCKLLQNIARVPVLYGSSWLIMYLSIC